MPVFDPALEHEIPSEDELRAYLDELLPHSMFAPFRMTPEELSRAFPREILGRGGNKVR
jgi:hypothetical protein